MPIRDRPMNRSRPVGKKPEYVEISLPDETCLVEDSIVRGFMIAGSSGTS